MKATSQRLLLFTERASWAFGLAGLVWWTTFQVGVATSTKQDLERFAASRLVAQEVGTADLSLWSPQRIAAWRKALLEPAGAALAVLRIPKIRLEVPVLDGTDDRTLDRAVGYIEGTAQPGTVGNLGIAGHRDGFFRGLKDIAAGDVIEVDSRQRTDVYRVERTWVVDPEEVSVLDPTSTPALTLVTCYPFYFIGAAPHRFIVRAVLVADRPVSVPTALGGVLNPQVQTIAWSHLLVVPHRN
ncbi:MAG TPA: class D sortase [Vicinamibacterales bacterium]|jgi:sortase A|nr:class D sortase [Vicinamibacterales bacterium]